MSCAAGRQLVLTCSKSPFSATCQLFPICCMMPMASALTMRTGAFDCSSMPTTDDSGTVLRIRDSIVTVRLTAHRRFRKARPVMGKDAGDPYCCDPALAHPMRQQQSEPPRALAGHFDVIVRDTHGRIHGHIAAFRMPAEHDRGRIASDERKPSDLSRIEFTYRYADSWDGTGQRTAILKSSFHPTSVPSVPRKATYSESTWTATHVERHRGELLLFALAQIAPRTRRHATRGNAAIRRRRAATRADTRSYRRNSKRTCRHSFRRAAVHESAPSPPTSPHRTWAPDPSSRM